MKIESIAFQDHPFTTRNNDRTNRRPQHPSNGAKLSRRIFPIDSRSFTLFREKIEIVVFVLDLGGGNSVCALAHIREVNARASLIF